MNKVFLSYSSHDHHFAELLATKFEQRKVNIWRDQGSLRAGNEWRRGIEDGINESSAVIVALSINSCESSYVTYEWAYAIGKDKVIIPLKLGDCKIHPKLEPIQYLDFSINGALPWEMLFERIAEIDSDASMESVARQRPDADTLNDPTVKAIQNYLNQRGYRMMTFDRVRRRIDSDLTNEKLYKFIDEHNEVFAKATLKGDRPGIRFVD